MTAISQAAGFAALLVALAIAGGSLDGRSFALGLLAGLGGGAGLAAFYQALALGTMSIVSPLVACGAIVPFTISLATGERPGAISLAGAASRSRARWRRRARNAARTCPHRVRADALAVVAADELGVLVLRRKGGKFSLIATMPYDPTLN